VSHIAPVSLTGVISRRYRSKLSQVLYAMSRRVSWYLNGFREGHTSSYLICWVCIKEWKVFASAFLGIQNAFDFCHTYEICSVFPISPGSCSFIQQILPLGRNRNKTLPRIRNCNPQPTNSLWFCSNFTASGKIFLNPIKTSFLIFSLNFYANWSDPR
jgi:hypothetical protein